MSIFTGKLHEVRFFDSGDGVTTCRDCGWKLTELFLSKACDRCDGLLKEPVPEPAAADEHYAVVWADSATLTARAPMWNVIVNASLAEARNNAGRYAKRFGRPCAVVMFKGGKVEPSYRGLLREIKRVIWEEAQRQSPDDGCIRAVIQVFQP